MKKKYKKRCERIEIECGSDKQSLDIAYYFLIAERGFHLMGTFFSEYGYEEIPQFKYK